MASVSRREQEINKLLDNLYQVNNGEKIISWLDILKTYNSTDGKIPGLFNSSKIQIVTAKNDGIYNLILIWIRNNMDKFANYDFTGIPNKDFLFLRNTKVFKFKTIEEVQKWCDNPEIHPFNMTPIYPNSTEYKNIYNEAYKIYKRNKIDIADFPDKLPKNHILFGEIDLLYHNNIKTNLRIYNKIYKNNPKIQQICELFIKHFETIDKPTIFEQEVALIKSCFEGDYMLNAFEKYKKILMGFFFNENYIDVFSYPDRMRKLEEASMFNLSFKESHWFIQLLENNRFGNGEIIIEYLQKERSSSSNNKWMEDISKIYNTCKRVYKDIDDCFNPATGIIENPENKKYLPINDPLDPYFEEFEKKLEKIRKPIYSKLIDLTTFKPKENTFFLNNAQYAEFKKVKDLYEIDRKIYETKLELYEKTGKNGSSPKPPAKPVIVLPNGKNHTIGRELDPLHIKDEVIKSFKRDYKKALPIIEEYNKIKNMSYLELKNVSTNSPSSYVKELMRDNELLAMTKEEITNDVLYDYSGLADKCSESIDILTNEELDDENYPLSKLQLMVRMKVYTPDRQRYRTECIYAPKLYNYLIKCINAKEPFINPVTKAKYTQENIEELMKVMKIIDPSLEIPIFIKHMNDTLFTIEYKVMSRTYQNIDPSFGTTDTLKYYVIYLSRTVGGVEYNIYSICTFPADIEAEGEFASGSSDLTSNVMLFRIYKLFNEGRLLYNYTPPYRIQIAGRPGEHRYIKPAIHFNRYHVSRQWLKDGETTTKTDFINMFKHYAQELNNYIY